MQKPAETVDPEEMPNFRQWPPNGGSARQIQALHKFNPVRLDYIRREVCHFKGLDALSQTPFGLDLLDIGCGGGLLSEPMCRLGATVTGADASEENIKTASIHAAEQNLDIDYPQPPPPCWSMPDAALTLF